MNRIAAVAVSVLMALTATGCGTRHREESDTGSFNAENGTDLTCLAHQQDLPTSAYTGGEAADTTGVLEVLRYYTAHGRKPYCDGQPATEPDRRWADLYVRLGADRTNVAAILE